LTDWRLISSAPLDQDIELAVIERSEIHALVFPCRLTARGWTNARTGAGVTVAPTHWRPWARALGDHA
jgi:hypothetical protein